MRAIVLCFVLALGSGGCGSAEPAREGVDVPAGAESAVDLLRGRYPALQIDESGSGVSFRVRGRAPVIIVDGFRTPYAGEIRGILAEEVVEIEVLTSMADTMIYGADAARNGVLKITTSLGVRD